MFIIQVILCVILLLRIGGILLRKVDVNDKKSMHTNAYMYVVFLIGGLVSVIYNLGITSHILFGFLILYIIIYEINRQINYMNEINDDVIPKSRKKIIWIFLDIVEACFLIGMIIIYIYCTL